MSLKSTIRVPFTYFSQFEWNSRLVYISTYKSINCQLDVFSVVTPTQTLSQSHQVRCRCASRLLLWNGHPLKCRGFPVDWPVPFSPVQSARKFSAVLGVTSANSSNTMRPAVDRRRCACHILATHGKSWILLENNNSVNITFIHSGSVLFNLAGLDVM